MEYIKLGDLHTATCFLNSLFREWYDYIIYKSKNNLIILIQISDDECIQIPLLRYSILGRHEYVGKFYIKKNNQLNEIDFIDFLNHICTKLKSIYTIFLDQFIANVLSSRETIYKAIQMHATINNENPTFINSEQALLIGHHFHPTPKSRDKLTSTELSSYAPELKGKFSLCWLLVDNKILLHTQAKNIKDKNWLTTLFSQDYLQNDIHIPDHMLPVPMHPWQWQYLQQDPLIIEYLKNNQIIPLERTSLLWSATSSLRTVYRDNCPYMLKFSINLKLTNSLRVLRISEVARGILLHDVLETEKGKQFCYEFPHFHIMTEPAYLSLSDKKGNPIESSMLVCRHNPFNGDAAKNIYMLATLTQDNPFGGTNLLLDRIKNSSINISSMHQRLKKWFHDYLQLVVKPFLVAYAKYGIIMEGHPQNIVLTLENGFPVSAYFRDCQDHAYSQYGYQLYADSIPGMKENASNIADKDIGSHYFIYQVIFNSTFNVITILSKSQQIEEQELLRDLYELLTKIKNQNHYDQNCIDMLLFHSILLHKCNFRFALTQTNDNQLPSHPLDFYTPIPNLIYLVKIMSLKKKPTILYQHYFSNIQKTIIIRLFDISKDEERFIAWHQNPRVAKYWQLNGSREKAQLYLEKILSETHNEIAIMEINNEPVGYGEFYWAAYDSISQYYDYQDGDRGFHLLIGENLFLGIENTKSIFTAIMHYLYLANDQTQRLIVEPDKHNHQFIKYMQILPGWQFIKEANLSDKKAAIFMCHRSDFMFGKIS